MEPKLSHDPKEHVFIIDVGGRQGTILYQDAAPGVLDFQSTYIPGELRNRGLGRQLVSYALEWARDNNYRVIPSCWFVREVMGEEPKYADLKARRADL